MSKEIASLQAAHKLVTSFWAKTPFDSLVEAKLASVRQYLADRLDILLMLTENAAQK